VQTYVYWGPTPAKVHVAETCDGLDHADPRRVKPGEWASWLDVLACELVRPCRRCALDEALAAAFWHRDDYLGPTVGVCVASQGNPNEPGFGHDRHTDTSTTPSGTARLRALAARENLAVYDTCVGPVAWLAAPEGFARMLGRNFRTLTKTPVAPTEAEMEFAWRFVSRDGWEAFDRVDVWELAAAALT
jgi:hypothetical protein